MTANRTGTPTPEIRPLFATKPLFATGHLHSATGSAAIASPARRVRAAAAAAPTPAADDATASETAPAAVPKKQPAGTRSKSRSSGTAKPAKSAKSTRSGAATKSAGAAKTEGAAKPTNAARANGAAAKTTRTARATKATKATTNGTAAKTTAKPRSRKRTTARRPRLQYKVGQQLVYPLQGVGQVTTIEERPFRDDTLLYYVVYLEVSDMTIMVPVEKADELGIRAIVPRPEANGALRLIGEDYEPIPTDWKLRYQMNLDLLKAGSVSDIATVVRALYHRSRIKELPILERKLYDNARSLLVDELSFSLGKDKDTIQEMINTRLEAGVKP